MSLQLFVLNRLLRLTIKRRFHRNPNIMELRPIMAEIARRPARIPPHIRKAETHIAGVRTEEFRRADADERRAILYIHGGGWVAGAPANHYALLWRLADRLRIPVYAPDYRLAPEHPFPAGLEDCLAVYRALLDKGLSPSAIAIAGDSAGGNLTLALALKLKQLGLPQPAALVCLSPATELSAILPSRRTNRHSDVMFDERVFATVSQAYFGDRDASDPFISPLNGDLAGLPPTFFQCSSAEMLRDDSVEMAARMKAAGVPVTLDVWPRVFHVWQITADVLPEGRKAIERIVLFLKGALSQSALKKAA